MHYLEFVVVSAIIFPIVGQASGAGECRNSDVNCYDCDSRYDPYCADPFNKTLPPENKPATRICHGCCIKFLHKIPNNTGGIEEYVQRSCTENIIINYFMVDHVCMGEGKGRGKMCFCEDNFCNGASSLSLFHGLITSHSCLFLVALTIIIITQVSTIFTPSSVLAH